MLFLQTLIAPWHERTEAVAAVDEDDEDASNSNIVFDIQPTRARVLRKS
jgi:hypothetical protein